MQILTSIQELAKLPGPIFLAIGVFDGVHPGHRAVIERAVQDAEREKGTAVVVTFDPHPIRVLRPELAPKLLTATKHKIALLRELNVPALLIIPFTQDFAAREPADFIRELWRSCRVLREICVGHEWSFGRGRSGNLRLMQTLGDELGFDEVGIPAVKIDGQIVSSTLVRHAVRSGDLQQAARLLGRDYTVLGTVVKGAQLGRTIGYPTANLSVHSEQLPPNGVYAVEAEIGKRRMGGVMNIGLRPTVDASGTLSAEVHLFNYTGDLYGRDVDVIFRQFLRGEMRFANLSTLQTQIAKDAEEAGRQLRISKTPL